MLDFNKYNDVTDSEAMEINIETSSGQSVPNTKSGLTLKKSTITLDKSLSKLSLDKGVDLNNHKARVCVAIDYSGSMRSMYKGGMVQSALTRLMPVALMFDDNCELDVWIFDTGFYRMESMTLDNFDTYVDDIILSKNLRMGATSYSPVLKDIMGYYFVENKETNVPTFVIFITDGSNNDKKATNEIIKASSYQNVFIQFVGIGKEQFEYLEKLDDLKGRPVDNTGFIKITDLELIKDEDLYHKLLEQYPDWLRDKNLR